MMSNAPETSLLATADTRILGPWRVRVGFTSREAGNLGLHVDDELGGGMDASMVRTLNHRAALEEALGAGPFFYLNQVHGVEVAPLTAPSRVPTPSRSWPPWPTPR